MIGVYNFKLDDLAEHIRVFAETYNEQLHKWQTQGKTNKTVDDFVLYDDRKIKWSSSLKQFLAANVAAEIKDECFRKSLYRPFTSQYLYFDRVLTHRRGQFPLIFTTLTSETENRMICLTGSGSEKPFMTLTSDRIVDLHLTGAGCSTQCFPFYIYDEDGTNRRENITDWALEKFREQYKDSSITKWDIFHYVYAVLHHPVYLERYAANLKRELPRIPFVGADTKIFRAFAEAGAWLADIHVHYEQQPEYPLERIEQPGVALNWRVERMKLDKDKGSLHYNKFLTLSGIPSETFEYRLGNRSALEWVIDQYRTTTDARSGITNDPNRADDPQYIVRLVGQVITVSLETVKIVRSLPGLGIEKLQEV